MVEARFDGKPLQLAVVGCGVVARKHVKAAWALSPGVRLAALVDPVPGAAERLMTACRIPPAERARVSVFPDLASCLSALRPDLVAITTPSGSHADLALQAIGAGAHVLVEKPMTLDLADADRVLAAAREAGVSVAVGHIYRCFPLVGILVGDLRAGRFGRILSGSVHVRWGHDQAYYDQAAWRGTWAADGGALMNQSIHAFDLMAWLMGGEPARIRGTLARQARRMEAEDYGAGILEFRGGAVCLLEGTTTTDPRDHEALFFLQAEGGSVRAGLRRGTISVEIRDARDRNVTGSYIRRWLGTLGSVGRLRALRNLGNPHFALYADWIDAVRTGRAPVADGQSGRQALEMVLALYRSARTGTPVSFPLASGNTMDMAGFLDGPAAES